MVASFLIAFLRLRYSESVRGSQNPPSAQTYQYLPSQYLTLHHFNLPSPGWSRWNQIKPNSNRAFSRLKPPSTAMAAGPYKGGGEVLGSGEVVHVKV